MTTTKIITNTIYYLGLLFAIVFDFNNFQFYYGIVFVVIQIIFIVSEFIITKRQIPNEIVLVKINEPFTFKDLLFVIAFIIVLFVVINLLFKIFTSKYLVTYISIGIISAIIQYLLTRGKYTASFIIDKNKLFINDLILKSYNLETLKSINFNGFNETYTAEFANSKKIKIKLEDYRQDDINNFIAVMSTKSNCNIVISDNLKNKSAISA